MNQKLSLFQIVLLGVMVVAIVGGVIVFTTNKNKSELSSIPVVIWGTLSEDTISLWQEELNSVDKNAVNIIYTRFDENIFENSLIEALASDTAPDAVLLTDDMILRHENKIFLIAYNYYSQKQFKDNFIDAGEVLLREDGFLGFPLTIDPFVLYWNRTILRNEGITSPPKYWDDLLSLAPRLTVKDSRGEISRSAIAFGEYANVTNAKNILISLIQQAGNGIVFRDINNKKFYSALSDSFGFTIRPANTALNFYTQFSDPTREVYSWNKSMTDSLNAFISGDLAFHFGFASERSEILNKNPNLDFGISILPQSRSGSKSNPENSTLGKMVFVAILNKSNNIGNAFSTITKLTDAESIKTVSNLLKIAPVRRDVSEEFYSVDYMETFRRSALISKVFLDPNKKETDIIFKKMVESVVSGYDSVSGAVDRASTELEMLFN